jgi:pimeloyl-ACP methyl ester carboxylesterase
VNVRRVRTTTVTLEVAEAGEGGRPILLVHGFTGAKEDMADWVGPLADQGWHAVAPDLRGHGGSDHPDAEDEYHPEVLAADLVALADALGWDRFDLLGHSMGGALAQLVVLAHPDRVGALVLVGTFHGRIRTLDPDLVALGQAIVRHGGMAALAQVLAARRDADPEAAAARRRMEAARPGYGDYADRRLLACSPRMWLGLVPRFLAWPETLAAMAAVTAPTLVLVGSEDEAMRADCERLAATVPGARLVVFPGAGHSPQLEVPGAWWEAVSTFLAEVAAGRAR